MYKIMTPGPTQVAENVRLARSRECTNPDLDASFVEFYKETCEEIRHATLTRKTLSKKLEKKGIRNRVCIPEDGESYTL